MAKFILADEKSPSVTTPGQILFVIYHIYREANPPVRYEIMVFDYDEGASTYWMRLWDHMDSFLEKNVDLDDCGVYVMEGVTGVRIDEKGRMIEDGQDWEFTLIRRASETESACLLLD